MSTANSQQTPDAAFMTLYDRVVVPVFFAKLAAYGIQPQTLDDAQHLLEIGHMLMQQDQLDKQAAIDARGNLIAKAARDLQSVITGQSRSAATSTAASAVDQWHKAATLGFLQDSEITAAAKTLLNAAGAG